MTRDLEVAKSYLFERHAEDPDARYGLLASSRDKLLEPEWGVPNGWHSTQRLQVGPWYGEGDDDRRSCRRLEQCVTEFQAQGLELDAVLLAWGTDFVRTDGHWSDDDARRYQQPQRIRGAIISDDDLGAVETAVRRFEQGVLDDTDVVLHTADISRNRRSFERLSDPHERARFHAGVTAPFQARRTPRLCTGGGSERSVSA